MMLIGMVLFKRGVFGPESPTRRYTTLADSR